MWRKNHQQQPESTMKMTGNTILITGGGSGIGRALAEAFYRLGNKVIVSGRREMRLRTTIDANPGMVAVELDVRDPQDIRLVTEQIIAKHPMLNVLINNAGIMHVDDAAGTVDEDLLVATVTTNLGGPIRMSGALIPHLSKQRDPVIINVSSILAFVPLAPTAIYSATKAALHSYTLSQRYKLSKLGIRVIEIAPPWVRTELLNSLEEERALRSRISSKRPWRSWRPARTRFSSGLPRKCAQIPGRTNTSGGPV